MPRVYLSIQFHGMELELGGEFSAGRLESKTKRRVRFERELLGICLPPGQRDRFQNTIKIENKSRSYKARSDEGYVRFWEPTVLLQDML